jgi:hypothetical protein
MMPLLAQTITPQKQQPQTLLLLAPHQGAHLMASASGRPDSLNEIQEAALHGLWARLPSWQSGPTVLWGTPLDSAKEMGLRQKIVLCKFLRARNWDVDKADAMLQACLKVSHWR